MIPPSDARAVVLAILNGLFPSRTWDEVHPARLEAIVASAVAACPEKPAAWITWALDKLVDPEVARVAELVLEDAPVWARVHLEKLPRAVISRAATTPKMTDEQRALWHQRLEERGLR